MLCETWWHADMAAREMYRKVMHVGRWGRRLCCVRKDATRAFDMGLQTSCHVIWEMRKNRKEDIDRAGLSFLYETTQPLKVSRYPYSWIQPPTLPILSVISPLEAWTKAIQQRRNLVTKKFDCHMIKVYREQVTFRG